MYEQDISKNLCRWKQGDLLEEEENGRNLTVDAGDGSGGWDQKKRATSEDVALKIEKWVGLLVGQDHIKDSADNRQENEDNLPITRDNARRATFTSSTISGSWRLLQG